MGTLRKIIKTLLGGEESQASGRGVEAGAAVAPVASEARSPVAAANNAALVDHESFFDLSQLSPELHAIASRLKGPENEAAFQELNGIKARKPRVENVDYSRALAFLLKNQKHAAVEALKEELRWFPANEAARASLAKIQPLLGAASTPLSDDVEFQEILEVIRPYTMVSEARLLSLYTLAKDVLAREVPGNFVECGVAAGGASALLAAALKRHSKSPRKLFSFDTFEGMPPASAEDTHGGEHAESTGWGAGTCSAPIDSLLEAAEKLGARDMVEPVQGLFSETLPAYKGRIGPIAFLHVDGDWYASTRDVLDNLYDQVTPGGRMQVDDYGYWEGCKKAVTDFQAERDLTFQINVIDDTGVWIPK
jgi:hypothetical protein